MTSMVGALSLPLIDPPPPLPDGFTLRRGFVGAEEQAQLFAALAGVVAAAPPSQHRTKGGGTFSAALTNCGQVGWWSDTRGYRYVATSPLTGLVWPPIPGVFIEFIQRLMAETPWPDFAPDACLINYYTTGAKMGLHQDKDEADFAQPIITVCLGDAADFLVGGFARADKPVAFRVASGDVLVMGGASRMRFHGVRKVHTGTSPVAGLNGRYSLTFRKAT